MDPNVESVRGQFGAAVMMKVPDIPTAAETVGWWLITAPGQAQWSQYLMFCVRLTDGAPGSPEPSHKFEGTTHELLVAALNPSTRLTPVAVQILCRTRQDGIGRLMLRPLNFVEQFIATDDEMRQLMALAAGGVVHGVLPAEPPGYQLGHDMWLSALTKSLAHIRGEEHAS